MTPPSCTQSVASAMANEFGLSTDTQTALLARALPHALAATRANYLGGSPVIFGRGDEKNLKRQFKVAIVERWKNDPEMVRLATAAYNESPKKFFFVAPLAWILGQAVTAVFSWLVWRVLDYLWSHRNSRLVGVAAQECALTQGGE